MIYIERLRALRTDRDITQKEIASLLNVKQAAISKYELGVREYKISDIIKLCEFYNVSPEYILGFTDTPKSLPKK